MSDANAPRVLIIDDAHFIRDVFRKKLTQAGLPVAAVARNGEEGLAMAEQYRPNIVLLDIIMPIMQGIEALPQLRELLPDSLIVMLTSTSEQRLAIQCRQLGADAYLIKQNTIYESLPERIRALYEQQQHQRQSSPEAR